MTLIDLLKSVLDQWLWLTCRNQSEPRNTVDWNRFRQLFAHQMRLRQGNQLRKPLLPINRPCWLQLRHRNWFGYPKWNEIPQTDSTEAGLHEALSDSLLDADAAFDCGSDWLARNQLRLVKVRLTYRKWFLCLQLRLTAQSDSRTCSSDWLLRIKLLQLTVDWLPQRKSDSQRTYRSHRLSSAVDL